MRYLKIFLTATLTIAILAFLFYKIDIENIQRVFQMSNKYLLGLAAFILFLAPVVTAYRWKVVLGLLDHPISFSKAAAIYFANYPISKITPINSGDAIRAVYLKGSLSASKQLGGILAERLLDIAVLSILSLIGSLVMRLAYIPLISAAILIGIFLFFIIIPKIKLKPDNKWAVRLENFLFFFNSLSRQPLYFLSIAGLTLFSWLLVFIHIKVSFLAFGANIPLLSIIALQPMVIFIGLAPITLAGIGAREPAQIVLFSGLASASTALAVALTYSVVGQIIFSLLFLPVSFIVWKKLK